MSKTEVLGIFCILILMSSLWSLWRLYKKIGRVSLKTAKEIILKNARLRLWTTIAALGVLMLFIVVYNNAAASSASVIITLKHAEASKGQNVNGTRMNASEIICDEVIERAIKMGVFEDVSVDDLSNCLTVAPVIQGNSYNKDEYHISTEFLVSYRADRRTRHLDSQNVVKLIAYAYRDFYEENYIDGFSLLDMNFDQETEMESLDYIDMVKYLEKEAYKIEYYMYQMQEENPSFVSSQGDTFLSLAQRCANLNRVQIQDSLQSYILQNGVFKEPEEYVGRLNYENMTMDFAQRRASASSKVRNDIVTKYAEEIARIVRIPTWDEQGEYYMSQTKIGIDSLAVEAQQFASEAVDYSVEIASNNSILDYLNKNNFVTQDDTVNEVVDDISHTIEDLAEDAQIACNEFMQAKLNGCISAIVMQDSFMKLAVVCGGFFIMCLIALNFAAIVMACPERKD